jgi:hypothetical protein
MRWRIDLVEHWGFAKVGVRISMSHWEGDYHVGSARRAEARMRSSVAGNKQDARILLPQHCSSLSCESRTAPCPARLSGAEREPDSGTKDRMLDQRSIDRSETSDKLCNTGRHRIYNPDESTEIHLEKEVVKALGLIHTHPAQNACFMHRYPFVVFFSCTSHSSHLTYL